MATNDTHAGDYRGPDASKIRDMFSSIASTYDRGNSVLSAGIHHLWRRALVKWSGARTGQSVLDCATGTGDLAIAFKKAVGPSGRVVGTDFCQEMLDPAPAKARAEGFEIQFELADVTKLPYADASFDIASISFGIRNVNEPKLGLAELHRVLKPGGTLMVLEFGQPKNAAFASLYGFYSKKILPVIGGLVSGKPEAYRYLEKSSAKFPCAEGFLELAREAAPFATAEYRTLSLGIAYMYRLTKK